MGSPDQLISQQRTRLKRLVAIPRDPDPGREQLTQAPRHGSRDASPAVADGRVVGAMSVLVSSTLRIAATRRLKRFVAGIPRCTNPTGRCSRNMHRALGPILCCAARVHDMLSTFQDLGAFLQTTKPHPELPTPPSWRQLMLVGILDLISPTLTVLLTVQCFGRTRSRSEPLSGSAWPRRRR
jgi:hypothetical protein